ncbi:hypothetical protein F8568_030530 [Actinomadura sp. LD22]|uniref:LytR family transcriptional regulator n=1 Tax=Actinomadura physcomitrii TaxID=2650748 RepID=A0A6I4MKZ4_9ACTN|nr:hypothetical protein [Actinomadura physcomitrii]MWA04637.1 hypothetical protein [Actinomadura physcomitrii]
MVDGDPAGGPAEAGGPGAGRTGSERAGAGRGRAPLRLAQALLIAAVSPLVPGIAHLRAGRVRLGGTLLGLQAAALTAAALAAGRYRALFLELSARPPWLLALVAACVALAALWALLIGHSYAVLAPEGLAPLWRLAGGTTVAVLCLLVIVPPLSLAQFGYVQRHLIRTVFADGPVAPAAVRLAARQGGAARWPGAPRLNVLLIGAAPDAARDPDPARDVDRVGDVTLASVDVRSGDTTLLALPAGLRRVPVWSGAEPVPFPPGRPLADVYREGAAHPELLAGGGPVRDPGAELLKRTVAHMLGQDVPYYVKVDASGVRALSGTGAPTAPAKKGCPFWAKLRETEPLAVLKRYQRLARVFINSVNTDVPRRLLPALAGPAAKIEDAEITSLRPAAGAAAAPRAGQVALRVLAARAPGAPVPAARPVTGLPILSVSCN